MSNKLILPKVTKRKRGCPKCGHESFDSRNVQGVITFTCKSCRNKWQGGIGSVPADPRIPEIPTNPADAPVLSFEKNSKGGVNEIRRRPSIVPEYRKGALIPNEDDDV